MLKQMLSSLLLLIVSFGIFLPRTHAAGVVSSGELVRGTTYSAVYYIGADGFRYVFPNLKTYGTWYSDFSGVQWISDADLATIQIGGNVTYKPGVRMVKIESDPDTYAVSAGGILRHIGSESIAASLYGSSWNTMIDDVPDGFFTNYTIGSEIASEDDALLFWNDVTASHVTVTINDDKELTAPTGVWINAEGYSREGTSFDNVVTFTIQAGQTILFWNVDDSGSPHTATATDGTWGTGTMQFDGKFSKKFATAGTYTFYDSYSTSHTGTIIVE